MRLWVTYRGSRLSLVFRLRLVGCELLVVVRIVKGIGEDNCCLRIVM